MLLAVDCGNTHIVLGLFQGEVLVRSWRISTEGNKTEDEYLAMLQVLLSQDALSLSEIEGMIVGSVVPRVTVAFNKMAKKHLRCPAYFVDHSTETEIRVLLDNPREVGADRILNVLAAHRKYGGALIVVDFGTATTFDCVSASGEYLGGAICPGIEIAQQALFSHAAKLANIDLYQPPSVIGKNSADSMRSGILWGYAGQVDCLCRRMKQEMQGDVRVIGTGGLASFIRSFTEEMEVVDTGLTLDGLRMVWDLYKNKISD
ncbi:MAG: type III pantothenate kinase [Bacillota bacterium]|nr:type III pantothenate kinase [Bacillota bacterium]